MLTHTINLAAGVVIKRILYYHISNDKTSSSFEISHHHLFNFYE